jgi:hypothetical protein
MQGLNFTDNESRLRYAVCFFVYAFSATAFSVLDAETDLWGHIQFGREIWEKGFIPSFDSYSYTVNGFPWINHEWLTEVLFYLIYLQFDSTGLLIFKLALGFFIIWLLSSFYFSKEKNLLIYVLFFTLLTAVLTIRFTTRPQLFSLLFSTILIISIYKYFDGNKKWLKAFPIIIAFWTNLHGGVLAGLGVLGCVVFIESVRSIFQSRSLDVTLLFIFVISLCALFASPYGYKLPLFFLETISKSREISEWKSISLLDTRFFHFKIIAFLAMLSIFSKREKKIWEIAIVGGAIYFAFKHVRHIAIASIISAPFILYNLSEICRHLKYFQIVKEFFEKRAVSTASVIIAIAFLQGCFVFQKYWNAKFRITVNPLVFPVYTAEFLSINKINGNLLTPFDWGEFFIWKRPQSKVSIDGRFWTVYPNKIFIHFLAFEEGMKGWENVLNIYPKTDLIISSRKNEKLPQLKDWTLIFKGLIADIYIRKSDPPTPLLRKHLNNQLLIPKKAPSLFFE